MNGNIMKLHEERRAMEEEVTKKLWNKVKVQHSYIHTQTHDFQSKILMFYQKSFL